MRVRILSRASDLAALQARLVARALTRQQPGLEIELVTRRSQGDRDQRTTLSAAPDKGLFTADLSDAVGAGYADIAVHSWKDLPITGPDRSSIAGTLERADTRDVLLVRRSIVDARPDTLTVLSSSPRRAWQMHQSLRPLLPWPCRSIEARPVRGNIPTRVLKLLAAEGDGLIVAKAALDRLLADDDSASVARLIRGALAETAWMVLPIREFPTAPAQGALALEVSKARAAIADLVRAISHEPTRQAVEAERAILAGYGGGCHEALGATVLIRDYGRITSVRGRTPDGTAICEWSSASFASPPPRASAASIWPRPGEREPRARRSIPATIPADAGALFVTRADALPEHVRPRDRQLVGVSGARTWERLAARGIWVNASSDGLGEAEVPNVDRLAGGPVEWLRLTHSGSGDRRAVATYTVEHVLPADLGARTHFFWTSGSAFLDALRQHPALRDGWHASGPGRTARVIRDTLGPDGHHSVWLEYDQWHRHVTQ